MSDTYIDTLDQAKVAATLAKDGVALAARYYTDDQRFALWLHLCNRRVAAAIGLGLDDIEDWSWRDAFDDGMKPSAAAAEALAYCGMGDL